MRLHVIFQQHGRLKAKWNWLDPTVATVLVTNHDTLTKLPEAARGRLTQIVETEDFAFDDLVRHTRAALDAHADGDPESLRIATIDESLIVPVARLREHFGIAGQRADEAVGFIDKLEMKRRVATSDVALPKHTRFDFDAFDSDPDGYLREITDELGTSLFAKPVSGAGSGDTARIDSPDDLADWAKRADRSVAYEVDEFVLGTLFHVDTVTAGGSIRAVMVSEYTCPNADFLAGRSLGSVALDPEEPAFAGCAEANAKALAALGASAGVYHLEVFHRESDGAFVFLEVAARPSGGMVTEMYEAAYGLNLHDMAFLVQLGGEPALPADASGPPARQRYITWVWVPPLAGTVVSRQQPATEGTVEVYWRCAEGDVLAPPSDVVGRTAGVFVTARDRASARRDFEYLRDEYQPLVVR